MLKGKRAQDISAVAIFGWAVLLTLSIWTLDTWLITMFVILWAAIFIVGYNMEVRFVGTPKGPRTKKSAALVAFLYPLIITFITVTFTMPRYIRRLFG